MAWAWCTFPMLTTFTCSPEILHDTLGQCTLAWKSCRYILKSNCIRSDSFGMFQLSIISTLSNRPRGRHLSSTSFQDQACVPAVSISCMYMFAQWVSMRRNNLPLKLQHPPPNAPAQMLCKFAKMLRSFLGLLLRRARLIRSLLFR